MKTKSFLGILGLFLFVVSFISCDNDDEQGRKITDYKEYILTIASKKVPGVMSSCGNNYLTDVYAVKKEQSNDWVPFGGIKGFDFEKEYEYKIKISETTFLDYSMGEPAWTEYELLETISKEKKVSEDLPLHFIPEWYYEDQFIPEYRFAVEADNKEVIEEDLKANSIMPLNYHYLLYRGDNKLMTWIAIKDNNTMLSPKFIKSTNKKSEELPDSYTMLPPKGNVMGCMEWTFLNEYGNETDIPSFDVFVGYFEKSRSTGPTPNTACLYKDLTEHYKSKYPEAGVKTVVVSYDISIRL